MLEIFLLIAGLAVLAEASSFTIDNAIKLSKSSGINEMTIGFIFIAIATSLPELSIAIISSLSENGALSMGNLIGADITNLSLIFGIIAFIGFKIKRRDVENISLAVILVSIISIFLIILRRTDLALGVFLLIIFYLFSRIILDSGIKISNRFRPNRTNIAKLSILILGGVGMVIISAYIVTYYAVFIASEFGLSEALIGATIIALGTTLPELSVNLAAVHKKNPELAIGNSIGSIVTNMTLILGIASIINPISVGVSSFVALILLLFISLVFVFIANRLSFNKKEGIVLFMLYFFYLIFLMWA